MNTELDVDDALSVFFVPLVFSSVLKVPLWWFYFIRYCNPKSNQLGFNNKSLVLVKCCKDCR